MPLQVAKLNRSLLKIFKDMPPTPRKVADEMARAYAAYAVDAVAGAGAVVLLPTATKLLADTLFVAIQSPPLGTPPTMAGAWGVGYTAFWMAPPVVVAGPAVVGAVTAAAGAGALVPALTATFANIANTPEIAATSIAVSLHTATLLVVATISVSGGPPTVVPLL